MPTFPILSNASMNANSCALILSPDRANYHEILNVSDQPAAFLDILSPPYNHVEEPELIATGDLEKRECRFFKTINLPTPPEMDKKITWLKMIQAPSDYYCDTEPYRGPIINKEAIKQIGASL